jgi:uncharacterized protein (DUF305 family)
MLKSVLTILSLSIVVLGPAASQHQNHGAAPKAAPAAQPASAATKAFQEVNTRMHKAMDIAYSGNADVDFARGMIPHHQAAVEMAKVILAHGKDPEMRKLAEAVIASQDKEIIFMREWLKKNGH